MPFDAAFSDFCINTLRSPAYPGHIPESVTGPAYSYQRISSDQVPTLAGVSRITRARYQISAWAQSYDDAARLAENARGVLQGYNGNMAGYQILNTTIHRQFDLYVPAANASDQGSYGRITEFFITYVNG